MNELCIGNHIAGQERDRDGKSFGHLEHKGLINFHIFLFLVCSKLFNEKFSNIYKNNHVYTYVRAKAYIMRYIGSFRLIVLKVCQIIGKIHLVQNELKKTDQCLIQILLR